MKKRNLILALLLAVSVASFAQDELDNILKGNAQNAEYLANGYFSPALKAFGVGLNQGWYNTAKVHKFPGVDVTLTVSQVRIPTADQFFMVDNSKLTSTTTAGVSTAIKLERDHLGAPVATTGQGQMPTMFGPNDTQSQFRLFANSTPVPNTLGGNISGAPGIGIAFLPLPIAHVGIGLPKGFDIKIRYIPTINFADFSDVNGEVGMFGIGVMHDVKQYIPGIKMLPFDLSAFVGYTNMKFDVGFNNSRPDQKGEFRSTATTIQALISKKFSVLTVYGGIGYNISKTELGIKGAYDFNNDTVYESNLNFTIDGSASGPRATAGVRLKLAVLTLHADYTVQEFNTLSAGIGLSVRN